MELPTEKRDIKMIFVGDSSVGKSCIIQKFMTNDFSNDISPTIGAAFISKEMIYNQKNIILNIWDTAGQEAYRYLVPMYYRNAEIAIIVFDLTKKSTFQSIPGWIEDVRKNVGEDVLIYLCGNKADLTELRQVKQEEIESIQKEFNISYYETSALNGQNINILFDKSLQTFLKQNPDGSKKARRQNTPEAASKPCC